jgi:peroxiredoxin Q/BCP
MSLQAGQKLPDFELKDENGTTISNQTLVGQKVIISIYAQDDTPSCTKQVCSLNEDVSEFEKAGYKVYGLSPDAEKKHQKFKGKYNITYPLLSDPEREVLKSWGLFGPKKFMGKEVTGVYRSAIVLDENGIITHFIDKVVTATHGQQLKEILGL